MTNEATVWVQVPAAWIQREDGKAYLTSGGHSFGPVLAVTTPRKPTPPQSPPVTVTNVAVTDPYDRELLVQAAEKVIESQSGSASLIQRKVRIGFVRAMRFIVLLEAAGVVGPLIAVDKARKVLVPKNRMEDALNVLRQELAVDEIEVAR